MTREQQLEAALQAFLDLQWVPEGAPGCAYYEVSPTANAREARKQASILLTGKSCFPSDIDGTIMTFSSGKHAVWLGGKSYDEDRRDLVPDQYKDLFDIVLGNTQDGYH